MPIWKELNITETILLAGNSGVRFEYVKTKGSVRCNETAPNTKGSIESFLSYCTGTWKANAGDVILIKIGMAIPSEMARYKLKKIMPEISSRSKLYFYIRPACLVINYIIGNCKYTCVLFLYILLYRWSSLELWKVTFIGSLENTCHSI